MFKHIDTYYSSQVSVLQQLPIRELSSLSEETLALPPFINIAKLIPLLHLHISMCI